MKVYILVIFAFLILIYIFFYPIAVLFDHSETNYLSLNLENSGMPHENYTVLFIPRTEWPFISSIAIDPINTNIIYAGSDNYGVLRSDDGGTTWQQKSNGLPNKSYITSKKEPEIIEKLAFDSSDNIYTSLYTDYKHSYQVYVSKDKGENWEKADEGAYLGSNIQPNNNLQKINEGTAITTDPVNKNFLISVNHDTISISKDNGRTWNEIYGSHIKPIFKNRLFDPARFIYLFLAWVSPSGWLLNYTGINGDSYFTTPIVFSPKDKSTVFVGTSQGVMKGKLNIYE